MSNDSKLGGVLAIISGAIGMLRVFGYLFMICIIVFSEIYSTRDYSTNYSDIFFPIIIFLLSGFFIFFLGALSIAGGIVALKRKSWGWALAGAIASTIIFLPCGIVALIFIAKSQQEFKPPAPAQTSGISPDPVI
jgi:hypothetical protein